MKLSRVISRSGVAAVASLLLVTGVAQPALADDHAQLSPELLQQLDERADALGISQQVKEDLIDKYTQGIPLDSMTDVQPVERVTTVLGGEEVTRSVYPDGSVSITTVQIPSLAPSGEGMEGVMAIEGCTHQLGAGTFPFTNCEVNTVQFLFSIGFLMDGHRAASPLYAGISRVYDLDYTTLGSTVTSTNLAIVKASQNASGPAHARAILYWEAFGGVGSGTYKLSGYVDYMSIYDVA